MQTAKSRSGSSEGPQRTSPGTPRRQTKTTGSDSDSASSGHPSVRTSTDRSPKVLERKSPRSPASEKKRPSRITELETQLSRLQEDLKKAKEQLNASESWKTQAQQDADEAKKHLAIMATKLEESQQQLIDLSAAEEARLQELRKISQERDRAWESELEALQKQHSMDTTALSSAMNEIQRLKYQIEEVGKSEAARVKEAEIAHAELQALKKDMVEALSLIDDLKSQLRDSKESEAQANTLSRETSMQLETCKAAAEQLRDDALTASESIKSMSAELAETRDQVASLEETITELRADLVRHENMTKIPEDLNRLPDQGTESQQVKSELALAKLEIEQLKSALEAAEMRYQEERIQTTMETQSAYELVEQTKTDTKQRISLLEENLKNARECVEELKANLMDKETELQGIVAENEGLNSEMEKFRLNQRDRVSENELKKAKEDVCDLKANLMDKETELQSILEENDLLKSEINKRDAESGQENTEIEAARAAEREALAKLNCVAEEADRNTKKAARLTEQLEAAQAANSEMEAELRRLRVQSDQWRKAAEAAAAVLSGHNGKVMERTGSLDAEYNHPLGGKLMSSPYSDDLDEGSPKKKNNMLKKIGVLWKKGQK